MLWLIEAGSQIVPKVQGFQSGGGGENLPWSPLVCSTKSPIAGMNDGQQKNILSAKENKWGLSLAMHLYK